MRCCTEISRMPDACTADQCLTCKTLLFGVGDAGLEPATSAV